MDHAEQASTSYEDTNYSCDSADIKLFVFTSQGVSYPAVMGIWSRWAPPSDRSRLLTITLSGSYFGTVAAMAVSGAVAEHLNWPAIFYVSGGFSDFFPYLYINMQNVNKTVMMIEESEILYSLF